MYYTKLKKVESNRSFYYFKDITLYSFRHLKFQPKIRFPT